MFDQFSRGRIGDLPGYTMVSMGLHVLLVGGLLAFAGLEIKNAAKKEVEVSFIGPGKGKGAPQPPPPVAKKRTTPTPPHKLVAKAEVLRLELPRPVEEIEEEEDDGVEGGVEGGVAGGVVGGVASGVVGGQGGGGSMQPRPERPRAKNVPAFAIAKDMVRQLAPRMPEVFKESHRGQTVGGVYKVCVDLDGSVYEVTPVRAIEGANDEIVEGIRSGWEYRPQQVPLCFLYNLVVRIDG